MSMVQKRTGESWRHLSVICMLLLLVVGGQVHHMMITVIINVLKADIEKVNNTEAAEGNM